MLLNSIERTAPIVGYDPYAFIMGKKSNYMQGIRQSGSIDYYAKNPENIYTTGEKAKKRFNITPHLKGFFTLGAVLIGAAALFLGKDKAKALNAASSTISNAGSTAAGASGSGNNSNVLITVKDFIVNNAKKAGKFFSNKFNAVSTFVKGKIHKP